MELEAGFVISASFLLVGMIGIVSYRARSASGLQLGNAFRSDSVFTEALHGLRGSHRRWPPDAAELLGKAAVRTGETKRRRAVVRTRRRHCHSSRLDRDAQRSSRTSIYSGTIVSKPANH